MRKSSLLLLGVGRTAAGGSLLAWRGAGGASEGVPTGGQQALGTRGRLPSSGGVICAMLRC